MTDLNIPTGGHPSSGHSNSQGGGIPSPGDLKPKIKNPDTDAQNVISNKKEIEQSSSGGLIEMKALRKGFFNQIRIRAGGKFFISSFEDLGSWMVCVDPEMEKKRKKYVKEKRRKKN